MANLFQTAKVAPKKPTTVAAKKAEVEYVEGLENYAIICHIEKVLEGLKETYRQPLDAEMLTHFVEAGLEIGKRPENYKGSEGDAEASLQFNKRSSRSGLNDVEVLLLEEYGIPIEEVDDVPATYIINPAYAKDEKLLEAVSSALSKIKGFPADFIQRQEPTTKKVVPEEALTEVFKIDAPTAVVRELADIVSTLVVRPKFTGTVHRALDKVAHMMNVKLKKNLTNDEGVVKTLKRGEK